MYTQHDSIVKHLNYWSSVYLTALISLTTILGHEDMPHSQNSFHKDWIRELAGWHSLRKSLDNQVSLGCSGKCAEGYQDCRGTGPG